MLEVLAPSATLTGEIFTVESSDLAAVEVARKQMSGAVRVSSQWAVEPVMKVLELERLTANWDGYGSPPVSNEVATRAIGILNRLGSFGFEELPSPTVSPTQGGGVIFEWARGGRELSISVKPDVTADYLKTEAGEPFEEDVISPGATGRLRETVSWLLLAPVSQAA
jgi:hypothetical protein